MRLALNFHPLLTTGRNRLLATLLAGLGVVSHAIGAEPAARADTPWKPGAQPEFIVPSGAGAALDTAARKLTELLARDGVTPAFVVSNRSGAHSIQALESLERRPAYGGALITLSSGYVTSLAQGALPPHLQRLTPVATLFREYAVVAVRHDSPIRDARDLIERLKVDPEAVSIGIATTLGNHIHIAIAQPLKQAGVDVKRLRIVPYKSSAESSTALVGGHLDVVSATTPRMSPRFHRSCSPEYRLVPNMDRPLASGEQPNPPCARNIWWDAARYSGNRISGRSTTTCPFKSLAMPSGTQSPMLKGASTTIEPR